MLFDRKPYTLDRIVRLAITAGLLWGLIWLIGYLSDVLIPFAVAMLLAYLLNPLVGLVQRKARNRIAAVAITLVGVAVVAGLVGWLLVHLISAEITRMGQLLSNLVRDSDLGRRAREMLPPDIWAALRDFLAREEVRSLFSGGSFWQSAATTAREILPGVWNLISGTVSFIFLTLIALAAVALYLVFLLVDYHRVAHRWQELIPPKHRGWIANFARDVHAAMRRYFRAQAAVAAIVGVLFATGFTIIGLPLAVVFGLFIGLLNMVPYLQNIGLVPAAFLALLHAIETGTSFWWVLAEVGAVFVVVQVIQDAILVPKIMGKATGMSPAIILLSLAIWGKLLGTLGLLIALPMTCVLWAYYQRVLAAGDQQSLSSSPPES
jgi:predicted PurR-regulated permease PerM